VKAFATSHIHYEVPELGIYGRDFPAVSLTGRSCSLLCKHCYSRLLERVYPATTPNELISLISKLRA